MTDKSQQEPLLKRHAIIAVIFTIGGLSVSFVVGLASIIACSMAGWGDGSTGDAVSNPTLSGCLLTLPFTIYFTLGVVAALSRSRSIRVGSSWIANTCLVYMVILTGIAVISLFPIGLIALVALVALFTKCWRILLPKEEIHAD